jgi:hypothetical protein
MKNSTSYSQNSEDQVIEMIFSNIGFKTKIFIEFDFDRHAAHPSGFFCNASLKANINVMKKKGYKFVRSVAGLNAFFVKEDCELKELSCEEGWEPHHSRTYEVHSRWDGTTRAVSPEIQFEWIEDLPWVSVSDKGIIATE